MERKSRLPLFGNFRNRTSSPPKNKKNASPKRATVDVIRNVPGPTGGVPPEVKKKSRTLPAAKCERYDATQERPDLSCDITNPARHVSTMSLPAYMVSPIFKRRYIRCEDMSDSSRPSSDTSLASAVPLSPCYETLIPCDKMTSPIYDTIEDLVPMQRSSTAPSLPGRGRKQNTDMKMEASSKDDFDLMSSSLTSLLGPKCHSQGVLWQSMDAGRPRSEDMAVSYVKDTEGQEGPTLTRPPYRRTYSSPSCGVRMAELRAGRTRHPGLPSSPPPIQEEDQPPYAKSNSPLPADRSSVRSGDRSSVTSNDSRYSGIYNDTSHIYAIYDIDRSSRARGAASAYSNRCYEGIGDIHDIETLPSASIHSSRGVENRVGVNTNIGVAGGEGHGGAVAAGWRLSLPQAHASADSSPHKTQITSQQSHNAVYDQASATDISLSSIYDQAADMIQSTTDSEVTPLNQKCPERIKTITGQRASQSSQNIPSKLPSTKSSSLKTPTRCDAAAQTTRSVLAERALPRPSTSHRAPAASHRAPATSHRAPATSHRAPASLLPARKREQQVWIPEKVQRVQSGDSLNNLMTLSSDTNSDTAKAEKKPPKLIPPRSRAAARELENYRKSRIAALSKKYSRPAQYQDSDTESSGSCDSCDFKARRKPADIDSDDVDKISLSSGLSSSLSSIVSTTSEGSCFPSPHPSRRHKSLERSQTDPSSDKSMLTSQHEVINISDMSQSAPSENIKTPKQDISSPCKSSLPSAQFRTKLSSSVMEGSVIGEKKVASKPKSKYYSKMSKSASAAQSKIKESDYLGVSSMSLSRLPQTRCEYVAREITEVHKARPLMSPSTSSVTSKTKTSPKSNTGSPRTPASRPSTPNSGKTSKIISSNSRSNSKSSLGSSRSNVNKQNSSNKSPSSPTKQQSMNNSRDDVRKTGAQNMMTSSVRSLHKTLSRESSIESTSSDKANAAKTKSSPRRPPVPPKRTTSLLPCSNQNNTKSSPDKPNTYPKAMKPDHIPRTSCQNSSTNQADRPKAKPESPKPAPRPNKPSKLSSFKPMSSSQSKLPGPSKTKPPIPQRKLTSSSNKNIQRADSKKDLVSKRACNDLSTETKTSCKKYIDINNIAFNEPNKLSSGSKMVESPTQKRYISCDESDLNFSCDEEQKQEGAPRQESSGHVTSEMKDFEIETVEVRRLIEVYHRGSVISRKVDDGNNETCESDTDNDTKCDDNDEKQKLDIVPQNDDKAKCDNTDSPVCDSGIMSESSEDSIHTVDSSKNHRSSVDSGRHTSDDSCNVSLDENSNKPCEVRVHCSVSKSDVVLDCFKRSPTLDSVGETDQSEHDHVSDVTDGTLTASDTEVPQDDVITPIVSSVVVPSVEVRSVSSSPDKDKVIVDATMKHCHSLDMGLLTDHDNADKFPSDSIKHGLSLDSHDLKNSLDKKVFKSESDETIKNESSDKNGKSKDSVNECLERTADAPLTSCQSDNLNEELTNTVSVSTSANSRVDNVSQVTWPSGPSIGYSTLERAASAAIFGEARRSRVKKDRLVMSRSTEHQSRSETSEAGDTANMKSLTPDPTPASNTNTSPPYHNLEATAKHNAIPDNIPTQNTSNNNLSSASNAETSDEDNTVNAEADRYEEMCDENLEALNGKLDDSTDLLDIDTPACDIPPPRPPKSLNLANKTLSSVADTTTNDIPPPRPPKTIGITTNGTNNEVINTTKPVKPHRSASSPDIPKNNPRGLCETPDSFPPDGSGMKRATGVTSRLNIRGTSDTEDDDVKNDITKMTTASMTPTAVSESSLHTTLTMKKELEGQPAWLVGSESSDSDAVEKEVTAAAAKLRQFIEDSLNDNKLPKVAKQEDYSISNHDSKPVAQTELPDVRENEEQNYLPSETPCAVDPSNSVPCDNSTNKNSKCDDLASDSKELKCDISSDRQTVVSKPPPSPNKPKLSMVNEQMNDFHKKRLSWECRSPTKPSHLPIFNPTSPNNEKTSPKCDIPTVGRARSFKELQAKFEQVTSPQNESRRNSREGPLQLPKSRLPSPKSQSPSDVSPTKVKLSMTSQVSRPDVIMRHDVRTSDWPERTSRTSKISRHSGDWGFMSRSMASPTRPSQVPPCLWSTEIGPEGIKRHSDPTTSPRVDEGYDTLRSTEKKASYWSHEDRHGGADSKVSVALD